METEAKSVEELIAAVLDDINQKGFSSVMPFSIGSVEARMSQFAASNGIDYKDRLFVPRLEIESFRYIT